MTPNDRPDDYPTNIVTEVDGVQAIVGECVICGETHYHGTTYRDPRKIPEDGYLGPVARTVMQGKRPETTRASTTLCWPTTRRSIDENPRPLHSRR